jgi:hypothetical protein
VVEFWRFDDGCPSNQNDKSPDCIIVPALIVY